MPALNPRTIVSWIALAFAVFEAIDAFFIEFPPAALFFAALFAAGWFWIRRGGIGGVVLVGVLCAVEFAAFPFYPRESATDWVVQLAAAVLGLIGLTAAVAVFIAHRKRSKTARATRAPTPPVR